MKVRGAGGFYEERIYDVPAETAWQLTQMVVDYMGISITELNEAVYLVQGEYKKKLFQVCVEELDGETCNVKVDCRKKMIEVYSFRTNSEEVNEFFEEFDKRMKQLNAYILCPTCRARIEASSRFCPRCGAHLK